MTIDITKWSNELLLKMIHMIEHDRLSASTMLGDQTPVEDPWPAGYEELVEEAQKRKLCL